MKRKRIVLALVVVVVLSSAFLIFTNYSLINQGPASPGESSWTLGVYPINIEQNNTSVVFQGEVRISGSKAGGTAEGVQILFLDQNNNTMESIEVGTMSSASNPREEISSEMEQYPTFILIEVERIKSDSPYIIKGLKRDANGNYTAYRQEIKFQNT